MQGLVACPSLYTILIDSLLRKISFPVGCFTDDIKFVADVTTHSVIKVQSAIDDVVNRFEENYSPLSIEKWGILHCDDKQPMNMYYIKGTAVKTMDKFTDLVATRCTAIKYCSHYQEHYQRIASKSASLWCCASHLSLKNPRFFVAGIPCAYFASLNVLLFSVDSGIEEVRKCARGFTTALYQVYWPAERKAI